MFNEGLVAGGREPNSLFSGLDSLWIIQDSSRQCLEVWGLVVIYSMCLKPLGRVSSRVRVLC